MKNILAVIVQSIIKHDCAMIMSLWKQSVCCITDVLGRAFHPWSFENGGEACSLTAQFLTAPYGYK